jgi:hypothetical protein
MLFRKKKLGCLHFFLLTRFSCNLRNLNLLQYSTNDFLPVMSIFIYSVAQGLAQLARRYVHFFCVALVIFDVYYIDRLVILNLNTTVNQ